MFPKNRDGMILLIDMKLEVKIGGLKTDIKFHNRMRRVGETERGIGSTSHNCENR